MRIIFPATFIVAFLILSGPLQAQNTNLDHTLQVQVRGLLPGANSFTENQARSRMRRAGFSKIEHLTQDASGIWRAKGVKNGQVMHVGLDFRGNVVGLPAISSANSESH